MRSDKPARQAGPRSRSQLERLLRLLARLGHDVDIVIREFSSERTGRLKVAAQSTP